MYGSDDELSISNILAENVISLFVSGRKACLFSDTPAGAQASAMHYRLIETVNAKGLEPYSYQVSAQGVNGDPYADSVEKYEVLLPWNTKNPKN